MERTLVLIKPDGIQRGLVGEVTKRLERKGLKLVGMKMMHLEDAIILEHYAHLVDKPFFEGMKQFMQSTPVIAQCWEGVEAVDAVRIIVGITKAREADAGSIRGDLSMGFQCNVVHASDNTDNAKREVERFFKEGELYDYDKTEYMHVYSDDEK
ncbi:nucleoside-diphosphate kinase [Patescibacteria group bacterium]|nr:nucleoside-diphosphate kinase [Patescibacteria group bacterium]MBU1682367.1 nucleoside-diphosphate kinase [Patescibacteria group bacterium]MBU1934841.1 nucleoside-diphosphate kinase [Patescibacteria group bacterium]